jgi:phenylacetate-CoA ligase
MNWLFKLSLKINGFPINKALKELNDISIKNQTSQERAWSAFNCHKSQSEFYRNFLIAKDCTSEETWTSIPVIRKSDFQRPLKEIIGEFVSSDLHVHNTSGSSGTPFYFAKDKFCHAMNWAQINQCLKQHDVTIGKSLQARFYGIPLGGLKYFKERLKDRLANRFRFPVFDLSDENLDKVLNTFRTKRFEYLNGYTSSLVVFAKYLISRELCLKIVCPTLKVVFPTSEVLDDIDREILFRAFGVNIFNEYGAAELDIIAFEDIDGDWIVNNRTLFVEILDEYDKPVPNGIEGRVVVTSLYNRAMPFVRYDLGDRAVMSNKTKKGQQILERVLGRTNDIIKLPSGKISPGLTFYYISKKILESGSGIKEFIVKQKSIDFFSLEYVSSNELSPEERNLIFSAMNQYLEPGLKCEFLRKEHIERTQAGKLKHFISEIK